MGTAVYTSGAVGKQERIGYDFPANAVRRLSQIACDFWHEKAYLLTRPPRLRGARKNDDLCTSGNTLIHACR